MIFMDSQSATIRLCFLDPSLAELFQMERLGWKALMEVNGLLTKKTKGIGRIGMDQTIRNGRLIQTNLGQAKKTAEAWAKPNKS